jgi:hypothetical protein
MIYRGCGTCVAEGVFATIWGALLFPWKVSFVMSSNSKFIPILFWIGFLALGFFTSVAAPTTRHPADEALVTEIDGGSGRASKTAQD